MGQMGHDTGKMTLEDDHGNWNYGFCETCVKNAHERVRMVKERIDPSHRKTEFFVCPECGSTKRL